MANLYVVSVVKDGNYDERRVAGLFTSLTKAQECANTLYGMESNEDAVAENYFDCYVDAISAPQEVTEWLVDWLNEND